jgi:hypothetical protein
MTDEYPIAYATRGNHTLTLIACPFCGGKHIHGIGDGPRVAHCGGGTYDLREIRSGTHD